MIDGKVAMLGDALYDRKDNIYGRAVIVTNALVCKNFKDEPSLMVMADGWPDEAPVPIKDLTWKQPMDPSFVEWYEKKYGHKISSITDINQVSTIEAWHTVWVEARKDYNADRDARGRMAQMLNLIRQMCESTLKVNG